MESDRFHFNFDREVIATMRRTIRELGSKSLWHRTLWALSLPIQERVERTNWLYKQIWLESSDGEGLVLWGQRFKIPKYANESDEEYRDRIIQERLVARGTASNTTRKKILQIVLGIEPEDVRIERVLDHHFRVGGPVGAPVATRDYAMHVYRIYAHYPDLESRIPKALKMLVKINLGGNIPELWLNTGVQTGPASPNDATPIYLPPDTQKFRYEVY